MNMRAFMLKAAKAVWDGPFYIGPLVQPVSAGSALLKLFDVIWKCGVIVASFGLALAAVVAVAAIIQRSQDSMTVAFKDELEVSAEYDILGCTKAQPVAVNINNKSNRTLYSASITLEISEKDRSTNMIIGDNSLAWDLIVKPGQYGGLCFQMPNGVSGDYRKLDYRAYISWAVPK